MSTKCESLHISRSPYERRPLNAVSCTCGAHRIDLKIAIWQLNFDFKTHIPFLQNLSSSSVSFSNYISEESEEPGLTVQFRLFESCGRSDAYCQGANYCGLDNFLPNPPTGFQTGTSSHFEQFGLYYKFYSKTEIPKTFKTSAFQFKRFELSVLWILNKIFLKSCLKSFIENLKFKTISFVERFYQPSNIGIDSIL